MDANVCLRGREHGRDQVLNNTVTPAGHRVINYLDVTRLVAGQDWEQVPKSGLGLGTLYSYVKQGKLCPVVPSPRPDREGGRARESERE